jgi:hypothetical protein
MLSPSTHSRQTWPQELIRLKSVRFGESVDSGKTQITLSAGLQRLVVLVRKPGFLSESFLGVTFSLPQLFDVQEQTLKALAFQSGQIRNGLVELEHPPIGSAIS